MNLDIQQTKIPFQYLIFKLKLKENDGINSINQNKIKKIGGKIIECYRK